MKILKNIFKNFWCVAWLALMIAWIICGIWVMRNGDITSHDYFVGWVVSAILMVYMAVEEYFEGSNRKKK